MSSGGRYKKICTILPYLLAMQITCQPKGTIYSAEIALKDDKESSLSQVVVICHWT